MKISILCKCVGIIVALPFYVLLPTSSVAGARSDHFVAWGSLGADAGSRELVERIKEFASSDRIDSVCGIQWENNDSLLYLNNRILRISDDLLQKVFIERDTKSFPALSRALRSFRHPERNVLDGLDGIVFYDGERSFRMMSFTVGARSVKTYPQAFKASAKTKEIERAFCSLLPPIVRAP
ncbi:hypothetical protein [uncultured Variovorax sp.]|uniref:hypothetical protein n=1 Tax=uncultured Variovorax sp. TaxID=114708 RepID=UPI0025CBB48D|nr:hypothetical protein [uncultured Variovorax sp.]